MAFKTEPEINDGGPAFPWGTNGHILGGMSLRDWFAGQALLATAGHLESSSIENIADNSYRIADAMLASRNGGK